MFRIIRLYSDDSYFRPIDFHPGINIVRGSNSKTQTGEIESRRQNGVGKSLTVDLIDFCLLKGDDQSRISLINDAYLPKDSFVNLHFKVDSGEFIISRNKAKEIKIKKVNEPYTSYSLTDAKAYLKKLVGLDKAPISLRDYMNFFIKNEDYKYTDFNELYTGSYTSLMKIHFYLFGISTSELEKIQKALEQFEMAKKIKTRVNAWMKKNDLEIEQLKARRNDLDEKISSLSKEFDYHSMVDDFAEKSDEVASLDKEIANLVDKRSLLSAELHSINSFVDDYDEDVYIDDADIKLIFNKYKKGLGDLVHADLKELYSFRDQLTLFRAELMQTKKDAINKEIAAINDQIKEKSKKVEGFYRNARGEHKTNIGKALGVYQSDILEMKEYDTYLQQYEEAEKEVNEATIKYNEAVGELSKIVLQLKAERDSFNKTFVSLHKEVTGNSSASFDFTVGVNSSPSSKKAFFSFKVATETNGNKGANQMRAALYDAALHQNEFVQPRTIGFLIHDNLLFGNMDQDSSIQFLNEVSKLDPESFQYITTANSDQFDYKELQERFSFDVGKSVVVDLTRKDPMFHVINQDFMK